MDEKDPDSVVFNWILNNIRDGKISEEDGKKIRKTCSRFGMGEEELQKVVFEQDGVMHLFSTNEQADKLNDLELLKLQQGMKKRKIARISAENSAGARSFPPAFVRRLANGFFYV